MEWGKEVVVVRFSLVKTYKSQDSLDWLGSLSILIFVLSWDTLIKHVHLIVCFWKFLNFNSNPQKLKCLKYWARSPCSILKCGSDFRWLDSVFSWYTSLFHQHRVFFVSVVTSLTVHLCTCLKSWEESNPYISAAVCTFWGCGSCSD